MVGRWIERATTAEDAAETAEAAATEAATTEAAADDVKGDGAARLLLRGRLADGLRSRLLREEHELGELLGTEGRLLRHGAAAGVRHLLVGGEGLAGAIGRAHAR